MCLSSLLSCRFDFASVFDKFTGELQNYIDSLVPLMVRLLDKYAIYTVSTQYLASMVQSVVSTSHTLAMPHTGEVVLDSQGMATIIGWLRVYSCLQVQNQCMDAASPPNDPVGLLTLNSTTYKLNRAPDPIKAGLAPGAGSSGNIVSFDCTESGAPQSTTTVAVVDVPAHGQSRFIFEYNVSYKIRNPSN